RQAGGAEQFVNSFIDVAQHQRFALLRRSKLAHPHAFGDISHPAPRGIEPDGGGIVALLDVRKPFALTRPASDELDRSWGSLPAVERMPPAPVFVRHQQVV